LVITAKKSKPIVKWSQLPDMAYGVNIKSVEQEPFVADDWRCVDPRAVTDVHFWGSYIGWDPGDPSSEPTPGVNAFVIRIFSDIPAGADPERRYSHPGELLYEAHIGDFVEEYVKTIVHSDGTKEHKFSYSLDLPEPFRQEEGTIYWISISAKMPQESKFPWGWETSNVHWNDNACRYWYNNQYWQEIKPSLLPDWYREIYKTVDMAFELSVSQPQPPPPPTAVKWQQRPDMKHGINIVSVPNPDPPDLVSVADDWLCFTGSPVTDLHFWGSYPELRASESGPIDPPNGVEAFRIRIYSDMPATPDSTSRPSVLLYEAWMPSSHFTETYVVSIPHPGGTYEHKFRYDLELPRIFWQRRGRVYWLSIAAKQRENFQYRWGWENSMDRWNDFAVKGWYKDVYDWAWDVLESAPFEIDFDELTPGASYPVGSTFYSYGIPIRVLPFATSEGVWTTDGEAIIDNSWQGTSGNVVNTNSVNIGFGFPYPLTGVTFRFDDAEGNLNISINGDFRNFDGYDDISGDFVGGVGVVAVGSGNVGKASLSGTVTSFALGGQEHFVDEVTYSRFLDMSFELTSCKGPLKWLQFPDMANGRNILSSADTPVVADDFLCTNGKPITEVHFWGSYFSRERHWAGGNPGPPLDVLPKPPKIDGFKISFHKDIPAGADPRVPYSHPGELIWEMGVGPDDFTVQYWDSIPHMDLAGGTWWEHKFYYVVKLPEPFEQSKGEIYWLDIAAVMPSDSNWQWGWETSKDHWNDKAVHWVGDRWEKLGGTTHVDFEDLTTGTHYVVGNTFTSGGITFTLENFQWTGGTWVGTGNAMVRNPGNAGGTGNDIFTNNINLHTSIECVTDTVSFKYADGGGNVNMGINGDFRNIENLVALDGMLVGGVFVSVTADVHNRGVVMLRGDVKDLVIGGQEFSIDDIHIECAPVDMAFGLVTKDDIEYCRADFYRDGDVDGSDLATMAEDFNRTDCYNTGDCEGDFRYDWDVDSDDLKIFAAEYGRDDCPCVLPNIELK
ncbi:MAG: hypothetical protein DRG83_12855, partial [Deltaproteobacteria bacterium]